MTKKPNIVFNFILSATLFFVTHSLLGQQVIKTTNIILADSLFRQQEYVESFEMYDDIVQKSGKTSPQMLMKMAFIKEGLGNYSQALLFLNRYYLATADKKALHKMEELAEEHNLTGYKSNDKHFFIGLLNRFFIPFYLSIITTSVLLILIVLYRKFKSKSNAWPYAIVLTLLLTSFYLMINLPLKNNQAIVLEDNAYLMTGPSSGSDLVDILDKGHRLEILDIDELWIKVIWQDQKAYVRQSKVQKVI
ncbi:MAG: SH3 domain-containing protein [Reichenbachiella sp.]